MTDYSIARTNMVDCQLRTSDVTNHELIAAMLEVPREAFVSDELKPLAYIDEDLALGIATNGTPRFLMEPAPLAKLLQLAAISSEDVVLDIGCASGYSSAVIAKLCSSVVAIEEDGVLADIATANLSELEADNVVVINAPHKDGFAKEAPFDAIVINGAVEQAPLQLIKQLKEGGRLVFVEGSGNSGQAQVCVRDATSHSCRAHFNAAVCPLPGFAVEHEFQF